jgi:uncharacterized membrane-anchored protein
MTRGAKAAAAISLIVIVGFASGFMYLVTTFLFHFSGGQVHMGPVVDYGALAVIALLILLAVIIWAVRSPAVAVKYTAIATGVAWAVAVVVEWGFAQFVFVTGAP